MFDTGLLEAGRESSTLCIRIYLEGHVMQARTWCRNTSIAGRSSCIVEERQAMMFIAECKVSIRLFEFYIMFRRGDFGGAQIESQHLAIKPRLCCYIARP